MVGFEVGFATLCHVTVIFKFVEIITFGVFSSMNIVDKGNMASSPTILTLENSGIYVGVPNGSKMSSNIE